nr:CRISPR-associated endonuclease Cas1 [Candidatus Baldrarchaeota archaeon]
MIIHIVTSDFTLKAKSKRYVVSLKEKEYEFPAIKTECIILNPHGNLTSAAVKLAEEHKTTIIFVDDNFKITYLSFLDAAKDIKYLLGQVESFLHRKEEYAKIFSKTAENSRKQIVKYLDLGFESEGDFWKDEEKYI